MPEELSIAVVDLLRRREEEFVTVWECEQAISGILGMPDYPFPAPPELPSRRKGRKVPVTRPLARASAAATWMLRGLDGLHENAYRVVYRYNGEEESSFQTDRSLVQSLIGVRASEFMVVRVESVYFRGMEDWDTVAVLWSSAADGDKEQGD